MERNLKNVIEQVANALGNEKAYNIPAVCEKYNIGDGKAYSQPANKTTFIFNLLLVKSEQFNIELAKKVIEDYGADWVGLALNQYYHGSYYKLSLISRQRLLDDLFSRENLERKLTVDNFLKASGLSGYYTKSADELFDFFNTGVRRIYH